MYYGANLINLEVKIVCIVVKLNRQSAAKTP